MEIHGIYGIDGNTWWTAWNRWNRWQENFGIWVQNWRPEIEVHGLICEARELSKQMGELLMLRQGLLFTTFRFCGLIDYLSDVIISQVWCEFTHRYPWHPWHLLGWGVYWFDAEVLPLCIFVVDDFYHTCVHIYIYLYYATGTLEKKNSGCAILCITIRCWVLLFKHTCILAFRIGRNDLKRSMWLVEPIWILPLGFQVIRRSSTLQGFLAYP